MQRTNTASLIAVLVTAFPLGWCLFPFLVGQTFHDAAFRKLQFACVCLCIPAFIAALTFYIIGENRIRRCRLKVLKDCPESDFGKWPQRIRLSSLALMISSIFSQGWVWMPSMIGQMYWEDYYGWMQLFVFMYSSPVLLLSLVAYIIAEKKIRRRHCSDAAWLD